MKNIFIRQWEFSQSRQKLEKTMWGGQGILNLGHIIRVCCNFELPVGWSVGFRATIIFFFIKLLIWLFLVILLIKYFFPILVSSLCIAIKAKLVNDL